MIHPSFYMSSFGNFAGMGWHLSYTILNTFIWHPMTAFLAKKESSLKSLLKLMLYRNIYNFIFILSRLIVILVILISLVILIWIIFKLIFINLVCPGSAALDIHPLRLLVSLDFYWAGFLFNSYSRHSTIFQIKWDDAFIIVCHGTRYKLRSGCC